MRIAIIQKNYIVGDLDGNAKTIIDAVGRITQEKPDLIVTSELSLFGYPPRDLLLFRRNLTRCWDKLEKIAYELTNSPPVLIGVPEINEDKTGRPIFNTAALIQDGKITKRFRKTLLPTYDVFDEDRYFEPSSRPQILQLNGKKIGITICEDIWNDKDFWEQRRYHIDPIQDLIRQGVQYLINISASPFTVGKQHIREEMLGNIARRYQVPLIYVNQVGGNDDLVFDGRSCVFNAEGVLISRATAFEEDALTVDLDNHSIQNIRPDDSNPEAEIWRVLVLGTRDYLRKTGFSDVVIGLSGGIDSALVAAVAAEAIGPNHVTGVLMPSPYSSKGSIDDSHLLAVQLGIHTITIPITPVMESYNCALRELFRGLDPDITEENIQARIRGNILMAHSNKMGSLVLTTGNKSEIAVGYCTLYGDMAGGFGVISDIPKTMVFRITQWLNKTKQRTLIPEEIIVKAPSAELHPDQKDQDTLPPYEILDEILKYHIEHHESAEEIIARGLPQETVRQVILRVKLSEFKRKQAAPGIKVTDRAFGTGWRMPIASKEI